MTNREHGVTQPRLPIASLLGRALRAGAVAFIAVLVVIVLGLTLRGEASRFVSSVILYPTAAVAISFTGGTILRVPEPALSRLLGFFIAPLLCSMLVVGFRFAHLVFLQLSVGPPAVHPPTSSHDEVI